MPENLVAVNFCRKIIKEVSNKQFSEVFKTVKELTSPENLDPYPMIVFNL